MVEWVPLPPLFVELVAIRCRCAAVMLLSRGTRATPPPPLEHAVRKLSTLRRFLNGAFLKDVGGLQIILSALHTGARPTDKSSGPVAGAAVSGPLPSLSFDPTKLSSVTVGGTAPMAWDVPR
jgi:hypothetical protein